MNVKDASTIRTETAEMVLHIAVNVTERTQEQTEVIMPTDTKRRMSMTESEYTIDELIDYMYRSLDDSDEEDIPFEKGVITALEKVQQYESIGTIERFRELTEKAEPKNIVINRQADVTFYHCPRCNELIADSIHLVVPQYCFSCGQKFSEE